MAMKIYRQTAIAIVVIFSVFSFAPAEAATVQFTQDTTLDLTGLDRVLYAGSGSACDSIDVSGGALTITGIPALGTFILSSGTVTVLQLSPQSGTANLTFNSGYFSGGYVAQWTESASSVVVEHHLAVASANTWYYLSLDGVFAENYLSDSTQRLSFSRTVGSQTRTFSITKGKISGSTPPPAPVTYSDSIVINQGAANTTARQVQLSLRAGNTAQMAVCNNVQFTGCPLETYQTAKSWTLTDGQGTKTVYVIFANSVGDTSPAVSDSIVYAIETSGGGGGGATVTLVTPPAVTTQPQPQTTTPAAQESSAPGALPLVTFEKPISQMTSVEISAKIAQILAVLETLKAMIQESQAVELSPGAVPAGYQLSGVLVSGQTSDSVKYLQVFLKAQGEEIYPEGIVSGWFGPKTKAAVIRFQEKYASEILSPLGLTAGTGKVGQATRNKINAMLSK